ncbi:MAG: TetR/AcrR family transcriptional regulator [Spirochaetaceae bacterium]|nr:TetR/AcrR family transcriptional regulator [Spirochaetaceae bacterium]
MPPKKRITKDMIINGAIEVTKQTGYESINARSVAEYLGCSTQPIMYHFATIEDLKQAAYAQVDKMHSEYLMAISSEETALLEIGLNYIRFAVEKPGLFRFLFQSGYAKESSLLEMIDSKEVRPVLAALRKASCLTTKKIKQVFLTVALFVHGYASLIVNNGLDYDEKLVSKHLEHAWNGAVLDATT